MTELLAPPADIDAERIVLATIILENNSRWEAFELLEAEDFQIDSHRKIFSAIAHLSEKNDPIDYYSVYCELRDRREAESIGGAAYICSLCEGTVPRSSLIYHAKQVRNAAQKRKVFNHLQSASVELGGYVNLEECLATIENGIIEIVADNRKQVSSAYGSFVGEVMLEMELQRNRQEGSLLGKTHGLRSLDERTTGLRNGELTVIAAWPGSGKSSLMCQSLYQNAQSGIPIGVFSLEMRKEEILKRNLSLASKIPYEHLRDPQYQNLLERQRLMEAAKEFHKLPIQVDDNGRQSVGELTARARMMIRRGAKIIYVDFVQLVHAAGDPRERNNTVSAALRELAKSENIPVVLLSQLRKPKDAQDRPTVFDLKETGNLNEDAHCVLLLYRPFKDGNFSGEDEIIIGKQRNGRVGKLNCYYSGKTLSFEERL